MSDQINLNSLPKDDEKAKEVLAKAVLTAQELLANTELNKTKTLRNGDIALLNYKIDELAKQVDAINKKLDDNYVTQDQFSPVKAVVYGMVGLILTGVLGAVIALIIMK